MFSKILVASDGTEGGFAALKAGIDLAEKYQAELHMITIQEIIYWGVPGDEVPLVVMEQQRLHLLGVQARSSDLANLSGIHLHNHLGMGDAVYHISEFATNLGADLLVMGFSAHCALYRFFMSSTTDGLINNILCSVLAVKLPDTTTEDTGVKKL